MGEESDDGNEMWIPPPQQTYAPAGATTPSASEQMSSFAFTKAYEKIPVPKFPNVANTNQWLIQLEFNLSTAGNFIDKAEIA